MKVFEGHSHKTNAREALAEATEGWPRAKLDLLLVFASSAQDPSALAAAITERFGDTPVVGCTTSGEHLDGEHYNGSLVVAGLQTPSVRFATGVARDLARFDEAAAKATSDELIAKLGVQREDLDAQKHFCLVFIDGLSRKEEVVSALMADALEGIPLLGGSAGDDLKFAETRVFHRGEAVLSGAVFALAESAMPFTVLKHQHYTTTPKSLVITRADVPNRRVYEMDGYRAIDAYARALGMPLADVTPDVTFMNPLTFVCANEIYVRSIQRVEPDGSIVFYCGIEEGMVLSVGGHEDMEAALERDLGHILEHRASFLLACNCILRALEADKGRHQPRLGKTLKRFAEHVVGFDTYGEQLSGLHINQTLVGLALHEAPRAPASTMERGA